MDVWLVTKSRRNEGYFIKGIFSNREKAVELSEKIASESNLFPTIDLENCKMWEGNVDVLEVWRKEVK